MSFFQKRALPKFKIYNISRVSYADALRLQQRIEAAQLQYVDRLQRFLAEHPGLSVSGTLVRQLDSFRGKVAVAGGGRVSTTTSHPLSRPPICPTSCVSRVRTTRCFCSSTRPSSLSACALESSTRSFRNCSRRCARSSFASRTRSRQQRTTLQTRTTSRSREPRTTWRRTAEASSRITGPGSSSPTRSSTSWTLRTLRRAQPTRTARPLCRSGST